MLPRLFTMVLAAILALAGCQASYGAYHRVRLGDSLDGLAATYQIDALELAHRNDIAKGDDIEPGMALFIPGVDTTDLISPAMPTEAELALEESCPGCGSAGSGEGDTAMRSHRPPAGEGGHQVARAGNRQTSLQRQERARASRQKRLRRDGRSGRSARLHQRTRARVQRVRRQQSRARARRADRAQQAPQVQHKLLWPVQGSVVKAFLTGQAAGHRGISIAAKRRSTVIAAANGTVLYTGSEVRTLGSLILIKHANGFITVYGQLHHPLVRRGQQVRVGQPIGRLGDGVGGGPPRLYFELRHGRNVYDPMRYLP